MKKNRLKEILVQEGITQSELARVSDLSIGTVNRTCNHSRLPSKTTCMKMIKGLNQLADMEYHYENVFFRN
jgi:DNA-binding XRE family transcriptional regulator